MQLHGASPHRIEGKEGRLGSDPEAGMQMAIGGCRWRESPYVMTAGVAMLWAGLLQGRLQRQVRGHGGTAMKVRENEPSQLPGTACRRLREAGSHGKGSGSHDRRPLNP